MELLRQTAHRPWPLPDRPWVMAQTWHDLLFAHARVPLASLRAVVPAALEIDTFDGEAWLGVVPFRMSGVRLRATPPWPWISAFPELNLRTYVVVDGAPGVYFFCLEAANPLAVAFARRWFHLPYFLARMSCRPDLERDRESILYESQRTHRDARPAALRARYGPVSGIEPARTGTLEHWLTERYCLYTLDDRGRVIRGDIHHRPWPLQRAQAEIETCTLPQAHGLALGAGELHLLFARRLDVVVWAPKRVTVASRGSP